MADKGPVQPQNRFYYFDFLRASAIFAVIILHNSADLAGQYGKVPYADWLPAAFYNGLTRFCVPLFVMLSGALLLNPDKEVTLTELFRKRLPKLLIPLVVWSIIYEAFQFCTDKGYGKFDLITALKNFYQGPLVFHFWFFYMMLGMYLAYPVLNAFIRSASRSLIRYFIVMWFITNGVCAIIGTSTGSNIAVELDFFTGYVGYFVLGYYLNTATFSANQLKLIYVLAIAGLAASVLGIILLQINHSKVYIFVAESDFTPDIPLVAAGVFLLVKNYRFKLQPGWWQKLIGQVSALSYGIFIVHVLFLRLLFDDIYLNITFTHQNLFWVIPFKSFVVLVLSFGLTRLIRMVPWLKATV